MTWSFGRWRQARIIKRARIDEAHWLRALERYPFLAGLDAEETARLRERVALFLHDKQIHGAAGLQLDAEMKLAIAVQACLVILNLPPDWYDGWVEVIVYPDEFVPRIEWEDEYGVVHESREPHAGEAWLQGPVILSWSEVAQTRGDGVNVVIHEFAHKLDMLNGEADGFPPLHAEMDRNRWTGAFSAAYSDFCARIDRDLPTAIDPYGAESPGEFFAVVSEAFFELPETVRDSYADVYQQLVHFYRQDPYARHLAAGLLQPVG